MTRATNQPPVRWGIMGSARITRKLIPALQATGAQVVAIAASHREKAEQVANTHGIPRAYEGYARLLADPEVEAVYLPLANSLHREWLIATAAAGKACLCEKPLVLSARDARDVRERFSGAGCRLQEAFMWRHHPQVAWLEEQFVPGKLGEVRRLHATFSFSLDRPADYRWSAAMGGGRVATVSCSFTSAFSQRIELVGSEGQAWLERPWLTVDLPARVLVERANQPDVREFKPTNSYCAMIEHFTRAVRDPSAELWPAEDGCTQAVAMEGVVESARRGGAVWRYG